jgi:hypothetical protein
MGIWSAFAGTGRGLVVAQILQGYVQYVRDKQGKSQA